MPTAPLRPRSSDARSSPPRVLRARPVRVASVPAGHPYVFAVTAAAGVEVLPDPLRPGRTVWWPPAVLDPAWIRAHRGDVDLLHIHFGTESFGPGHLTACLAAAHEVGWPVVYTVHDLQHPQLVDQRAYDRQLDELVRGADALVTLTAGAAGVVRRRWDRDALVLPHPSILPRDAVTPVTGPSEVVRVGVHLKDLRPSVDGPGAVAALTAAVARLRANGIAAVAEVRMHRDVRDEADRDEVRRRAADAVHTTLIEHDRLSDGQLAEALGRLDVCVLPYRSGTHSGWLELCWDLGVAVAAPAVGFLAEQHDDGTVRTYADGDLAATIEALLTDAATTRAGTPDRRRGMMARAAIRADTDARTALAHAHLYGALVEERAS